MGVEELYTTMHRVTAEINRKSNEMILGVVREILTENGHESVYAINEKAVIKAFEALERQRWIPCSERLPGEPEYGIDGYIVQRRKVYEPHSAYWDGELWSDDECNIFQDVIAWQPLPERYEGGE